MTAAYVPRSTTVLGPAVMPRGCVHAVIEDEACVLVVHHVRERKTGPRIPVTVLQCQTHGRAFTLYPLGHLPYGRLAIAPVGLDGELLRSTDGEPQVDGKRPPAWSTTLFGSAFTAIHAATVKLTDPRWWATEAPERLAQSAAILGVHPELSVRTADAVAFRLEKLAECLGVGLSQLMRIRALECWARHRHRRARRRSGLPSYSAMRSRQAVARCSITLATGIL